MSDRSRKSSLGRCRRWLSLLARRPLLTLTVLATLVPLAVVATESAASATTADITSSGPLTDLWVSDDLSCAVNHTGDSAGEWFGYPWEPDPALHNTCGTMVAVGGTLYKPAALETWITTGTFYTPVSQTSVSGTGTDASPYQVTTVVALGATGIQVEETDSYVVGQETYRTDVSLHNTTGSPVSAILYRAGDCYLQDSDYGLGQITNGSALCQADPGSANPDRIEGFIPLTPGAHFLEDEYSVVWNAVGSQQQLPDTCQCGNLIDNGTALSWPVTVPANGTAGVSSLAVFSPYGGSPVTLEETADAATTDPGGADGYTVTLSNPGAIPQTVTSIVETLPGGFSYVPGSSTGLTSADPQVQNGTLTWDGSYIVPAGSGGDPGQLTLHFGVTASTHTGTYTSSVAGAALATTVIGADDVAPITVQGATPPPPPPPPPAPSCFGVTATIVGSSGDDVLVGTPSRDVVVAKGGDDTIRGRGGNDLICSGAGNDTVYGGDGADHIDGARGQDHLLGGAGADVLSGGFEPSTLRPTLGDRTSLPGDVLVGGGGNDVLLGQRQDDRLYGSAGRDDLRGGRGNDRLVGGPGRDTLAGGPGKDALIQ